MPRRPKAKKIYREEPRCLRSYASQSICEIGRDGAAGPSDLESAKDGTCFSPRHRSPAPSISIDPSGCGVTGPSLDQRGRAASLLA